MADVKWVKLSVGMFDNRKIRYLRRLPDGDSVVLIWVMLLTLAGRCNAGGMIFLTENIPYSTKMLADELDFEESTVQLALNALERLNMISTDSTGALFVTGWEEHQNIESMEKIRESKRLAQARWRQKKKLLIAENSVESTVDCSTVDSTRISVDHADKEEERRKKNKNKSVKESAHTIFERLVSDYDLPDELRGKMYDWIAYKIERKEPYREQGMKALLKQVQSNVQEYGERAVCELIDECMASGWKGIIFDRLKNKAQTPRKQTKAEAELCSCSPDDLQEYPPGSGNYVLRAEIAQR